jgi:hypothetical protein
LCDFCSLLVLIWILASALAVLGVAGGAARKHKLAEGRAVDKTPVSFVLAELSILSSREGIFIPHTPEIHKEILSWRSFLPETAGVSPVSTKSIIYSFQTWKSASTVHAILPDSFWRALFQMILRRLSKPEPAAVAASLQKADCPAPTP